MRNRWVLFVPLAIMELLFGAFVYLSLIHI